MAIWERPVNVVWGRAVNVLRLNSVLGQICPRLDHRLLATWMYTQSMLATWIDYVGGIIASLGSQASQSSRLNCLIIVCVVLYNFQIKDSEEIESVFIQGASPYSDVTLGTVCLWVRVPPLGQLFESRLSQRGGSILDPLTTKSQYHCTSRGKIARLDGYQGFRSYSRWSCFRAILVCRISAISGNLLLEAFRLVHGNSNAKT